MDKTEANIFASELQGLPSVAGWKVHELLGHGKSAVVMRATKGGDRAALKVFHPPWIKEFGLEAQMLRIEREKRLIGIDHPHIVRILDAGRCEDCDKIYVAMEYLEGVTLRSNLSVIPAANIEPIVECLARAAKFLEDMGIVHRDIKPENIFLVGPGNKLVLLDFGVMRPVGDSGATDQMGRQRFIGTHQYAPSEMIHGKVADTLDGWRAVSFYQIGAVLHDLLVRRPLFDEYSSRIADLVIAIDKVDPQIPSSVGSAHQIALAKKCLLKDPKERLNLTTWASFFFSERPEVESTEARKRVLLDQRALATAGKRTQSFERVEETRILNARTKVYCRALRDQVDRVLDTLREGLPLRTVKGSETLHPLPTVSCSFAGERDPAFGYDFNFQFSFVSISENVVEVFVRAGRGAKPEEIGWTTLGRFLNDFSDLEGPIATWMIGITQELNEPKGV